MNPYQSPEEPIRPEGLTLVGRLADWASILSVRSEFVVGCVTGLVFGVAGVLLIEAYRLDKPLLLVLFPPVLLGWWAFLFHVLK